MTPLSADDRRTLLALAREAVTARVLQQVRPSPPLVTGRLALPRAAFVSLHVGPALRGCLGSYLPGDLSLSEVVIAMAGAAASNDPRFGPVSADELGQLVVEISVLGPLVVVSSPAEIVVGRDGLLVEHAGRRGLLLPQVAARLEWTADRFLAEACRKAGLPLDAWQTGARVSRFEAEVFSECPATPFTGV